jgi:S-adenosylmethionine decarboxylase
LKSKVIILIKKHGFTELGSYYHQFDIGVTGIISLSESHISIHTWPKEGYVSLDVFICNYTRDNSKETKLLFNDLVMFFHPGKSIRKTVVRHFESK